jgi:hypothetical protein
MHQKRQIAQNRMKDAATKPVWQIVPAGKGRFGERRVRRAGFSAIWTVLAIANMGQSPPLVEKPIAGSSTVDQSAIALFHV